MIISILIVAAGPVYNSGCGTWTRAGRSCFKFYQQPLLTWQGARTKCQSLKGDLINVVTFDLQVIFLILLHSKPLKPSLITFNQFESDHVFVTLCVDV